MKSAIYVLLTMGSLFVPLITSSLNEEIFIKINRRAGGGEGGRHLNWGRIFKSEISPCPCNITSRKRNIISTGAFYISHARALSLLEAPLVKFTWAANEPVKLHY